MARPIGFQRICTHSKIKTFCGGGQWKAVCLRCGRYGLLTTLQRERKERRKDEVAQVA